VTNLLTHKFCEFIRCGTKFKFLLGENVESYFNSAAWELIKEAAKEAGYHVVLKFLNTYDIGLATSRPRGFFLLVRGDVDTWNSAGFDKNYNMLHKYESSSTLSIADVKLDSGLAKETNRNFKKFLVTDPALTACYPTSEDEEKIMALTKSLPENGRDGYWVVDLVQSECYDGLHKTEGRTGCITTNNVKMKLYVTHKDFARCLLPQECALLLGFEEEALALMCKALDVASKPGLLRLAEVIGRSASPACWRVMGGALFSTVPGEFESQHNDIVDGYPSVGGYASASDGAAEAEAEAAVVGAAEAGQGAAVVDGAEHGSAVADNAAGDGAESVEAVANNAAGGEAASVEPVVDNAAGGEAVARGVVASVHLDAGPRRIANALLDVVAQWPPSFEFTDSNCAEACLRLLGFSAQIEEDYPVDYTYLFPELVHVAGGRIERNEKVVCWVKALQMVLQHNLMPGLRVGQLRVVKGCDSEAWDCSIMVFNASSSVRGGHAVIVLNDGRKFTIYDPGRRGVPHVIGRGGAPMAGGTLLAGIAWRQGAGAQAGDGPEHGSAVGAAVVEAASAGAERVREPAPEPGGKRQRKCPRPSPPALLDATESSSRRSQRRWLMRAGYPVPEGPLSEFLEDFLGMPSTVAVPAPAEAPRVADRPRKRLRERLNALMSMESDGRGNRVHFNGTLVAKHVLHDHMAELCTAADFTKLPWEQHWQSLDGVWVPGGRMSLWATESGGNYQHRFDSLGGGVGSIIAAALLLPEVVAAGVEHGPMLEAQFQAYRDHTKSFSTPKPAEIIPMHTDGKRVNNKCGIVVVYLSGLAKVRFEEPYQKGDSKAERKRKAAVNYAEYNAPVGSVTTMPAGADNIVTHGRETIFKAGASCKQNLAFASDASNIGISLVLRMRATGTQSATGTYMPGMDHAKNVRLVRSLPRWQQDANGVVSVPLHWQEPAASRLFHCRTIFGTVELDASIAAVLAANKEFGNDLVVGELQSGTRFTPGDVFNKRSAPAAVGLQSNSYGSAFHGKIEGISRGGKWIGGASSVFCSRANKFLKIMASAGSLRVGGYFTFEVIAPESPGSTWMAASLEHKLPIRMLGLLSEWGHCGGDVVAYLGDAVVSSSNGPWYTCRMEIVYAPQLRVLEAWIAGREGADCVGLHELGATRAK
jgi:site-specific DNA-cytosine methylase